MGRVQNVFYFCGVVMQLALAVTLAHCRGKGDFS